MDTGSQTSNSTTASDIESRFNIMAALMESESQTNTDRTNTHSTDLTTQGLEKIDPTKPSGPFDEPFILQHGGKWVRAYLNEALPRDNDYDTRALFKNCFTNAMFRRLFSDARGDRLGLEPPWITRYMIGEELCHKPMLQEMVLCAIYHRQDTVKLIRIVWRYSKGLIPLVARESHPSDLHQCGKIRLQKAMQALDQHPTLKYVLKGIIELTTKSLELGCDEWCIFHGLELRKPNGKLLAPYDQFIKEFEQAVFNGDLDWFRQRYDGEIIDPEEDDSNFEDADDTEFSPIPTPRKCMICRRCHKNPVREFA